jgi:cellulose 1,4-beta-cellobiosidase
MKHFHSLALAALFSVSYSQVAELPESVATSVPSAVKDVSEPVVTQAPEEQRAAGNPFQGVTQYANNFYASEVHTLAIPSLVNKALAAKASAVAKVPSFFWMYVSTLVPSVLF